MDILFQVGPLGVWVFAFLVAAVAGLVKGIVGFAMPMVLISGLSSLISPELALAGVILPTLVTNFWQALRQGVLEALSSVVKFRVFLLAGFITLVAAAQTVPYLSGSFMLLLIGMAVTLYAVATLTGKPLRLPSYPSAGTEAAIGAFAGFCGGISGIWGPPTVAMLTARETEMYEQIRVQGVIYGLGAVALTGAHLGSGVLDRQTMPFSILMVPPAVLGMWVGLSIQDRINQAMFRKVTLVVLLTAGLNLVRRGLMGEG